jgi:3-phenylpropionate/trans-cinnamate dioxygenase ferredoxin reductase subunit
LGAVEAKLFTWGIVVAALYALIYIRVIKPLLLRKRYYLVKDIVPERGKCWSITFVPFGHDGMRFNPGQFAWLTLGNSPFALEEHPFSFSSSARRSGELSMTIKELGDFTGRIGKTKRGMRAYLDGPHGAFTYKRKPKSEHMIFIAGGIGIAPIISMLRTLSDEEFDGNVLLFYCNKDWPEVTFRESLQELTSSLHLRIIHILESPKDSWAGERGYLNRKILRKYLPENLKRSDFYICGPLPLMELAEKILIEMGVGSQQIEMEKFNLV